MTVNKQGKDTIYIDIDDEITAIIDKVLSSKHNIVALVLPKRAAVLQSIVNMKLLKRTADHAKKHIVLISSEAGILPLAGDVGIYVAKSLQSKPEIPATMHQDRLEEKIEDTEFDDEPEPELDVAKPLSAYAPVTPAALAGVEDDSAIQFDNTTPVAAPKSRSKGAKTKKSKGLKVPDFNKFRMWLMLGGGGLIALIVLLYLAFGVLPRAKVTVKTDSIAVDTSVNLTLDTAATSLNVNDGVVPAVSTKSDKTSTQQVTSTGQKDNGQKATGQVTLTLKTCPTDPVVIPAGTGVSANGLTFITKTSATLLGTQKADHTCKNDQDATKVVDVVAQNAGDKYNVAATTYAVSNFSSSVSASGSAMTGGTSDIVKIISQADIDGAKQKIVAQNADAIKTELKKQLSDQGLFAIEETFIAGAPAVTSSANVGDQVPNFTLTTKTTYTMLGAKKADLEKLVANAAAGKLDPKKQKITNYGLDSAVFRITDLQALKAVGNMQSTAVAGSDIDLVAIKAKIAGKKAGDAKSIIGELPGVTSVDVSYSPFWVSSIPKNPSKITIIVEKPAANAK